VCLTFLFCGSAFDNTILDRKLHQSTETSLNRQAPTLTKLAKIYNNLCQQLETLRRQRKAPLGAIIPEQIELAAIFSLDVDDAIWQDVGLDEEHDGPVPQWLGDDNVRTGIKALLELDRCLEEETRLRKERCVMQEWMLEEWNSVQIACQAAGILIFNLVISSLTYLFNR